MDKYLRIEKLGEGSYGIVYKAQHKETGKYYALKRIRLEDENEGVPCSAIREIALLKILNHPNIIKLYDVLHSDKKLTLIFEYAQTDLKKYMEQQGQLPPPLIKKFVYQLIKGIAYCHSNRIIHRDLKPQNILVTADGTLKVADFGLARTFGIPIRNYSCDVVTLWYRAPEILLGCKQYATAIDMWSIGCIFAEMVLSSPLFAANTIKDELAKIVRMLGMPVDEYESWPGVPNLPDYKIVQLLELNPDAKPLDFSRLFPTLDEAGRDLLKKFLTYDPQQRITAEKALEHPFFKDIVF